MSEDTVSFKEGVVEQQTRKMKLLSAVKAKGNKDGAAWLEYLEFSRSIVESSATAANRAKQASEWATLAKLYASAISSIKGTDQELETFKLRIGMASATRSGLCCALEI